MSIKLLTYNTFLRPYCIKTNEDDFKQQRMQDMIKHFEPFDVVCLQECFDTFNHRQFEFLSMIEESGFRYTSISPGAGFCEGKLIDGGLVVISKYEIVESHFMDYGVMGQSDGLSKKGILFCRIAIPEEVVIETEMSDTHLINRELEEMVDSNQNCRFINVFCTHTQANYFTLTPKQVKGCFYIQFDQILRIRKFVESIYAKSKTNLDSGYGYIEKLYII